VNPFPAARLEQMTLSLGKEVLVLQEVDDPLLYLERKAYIRAIEDALSGVELARVTLARARQRIEATEPQGETCSVREGEATG
jgi:hypothetical protein